ncbi:hypothetical protein L1987_24076 [Smallanthus sonchifolius]|uniref:Uncharacterized protein n=1 Tax=Smallanthus sonchifolius TaxID=185202 RepID=A0ACB9IIN7_9ASTR|nr:hypothetical protein L1987_24076 [Smallanthus sonchifolius]
MFRQWNGERKGRSVERQRQGNIEGYIEKINEAYKRHNSAKVSFEIDGIVPTNWGKRKLAVAAVGVEEVAEESGDAGENEYRRRWGKMG